MREPLVPSSRVQIVVAAALGLLGTHAFGQSHTASSAVAIVNSAIAPYDGNLAETDAADGSVAVATATHSWTGLDRQGNTQTMTFTGTTRTQSTYGVLHSYATGTVTNTYYNAANPAAYNANTNTFNDAGSPDGLVSLGFADFDDTLQYGGALQAGYKARYVFHIEGTNSGYGGFADLGVTIGTDPTDQYFDIVNGTVATDFATVDHAINGTTPQTIHVQFSDQFTVGTQDVADGSTLSGTSDFSSTVTLAAIEVVDANGNPVSGVTMTSGSGTVYPSPEPATLGLIVPAALTLRRRRRNT